MDNDDGFITIPVRKPGPRPMTCDKRKVNAVVCNGKLTEVFDAMCWLEGRKPHQLVHDIVRDYLEAMEKVPEVRKIIRLQRLERSGIRPLE